MKQLFITSDPASKALILIFSGWATDETLFAGLAKRGYDIMVVYDYRNTAFDLDSIARYNEIVVIGWSFGVYYAERFINAHPSLPITRCIAVNGTLNPIDNEEGIPVDIFNKTALLPDLRSLDKFYTRICGGARARLQLMPTAPARNLDELRDELSIIGDYIKANGCHKADYRWDFILLAAADLIFPINNAVKAWDGRSEAVDVIEDAPHIPDFQAILDKYIISKQSAEEKFTAAQATYDDNAHVQRTVAITLLDLAQLPPNANRCQQILELGSGTGMLSSLYAPAYEDSDMLFIDFNPADNNCYDDSNRRVYDTSDAELRLRQFPDNSFNTIYSSSVIQWFNSPLKALREIHRTLRPDGRAVISYFDEDNLKELSAFMPVLKCPTFSADALLRMGYTVDCYTSIKYPRTFDRPIDALRHLRDTGVTGLGNAPLSPTQMRRLMSDMASDDGTATIIYSVRYLILTKHS